jgi:hypothetical protein
VPIHDVSVCCCSGRTVLIIVKHGAAHFDGSAHAERPDVGHDHQLPSMFLSGFFSGAYAPVCNGSAYWFRSSISDHHQAIVLKGAGLQLLTSEVWALVVFAVVMVVLAVSRFRKRLE